MIIPKKKTTGVARALGGLCLKTSETTPMVTGTRRLSPAAAPHLHGSSRGSFLQRFFTANENDMRLSAGICTAKLMPFTCCAHGVPVIASVSVVGIEESKFRNAPGRDI